MQSEQARLLAIGLQLRLLRKRRRSKVELLVALASGVMESGVLDSRYVARILGTASPREFWVRPKHGRMYAEITEDWPAYSARVENGLYLKWFHMSKAATWAVVEAVLDDPDALAVLHREDTKWRVAWPDAMRVLVTLQFLCINGQLKDLGQEYGCGESTACDFVHAGTAALHTVLVKTCIRFPRGAQLASLMQVTCASHGLIGCVAGVDGCHIPILCPPGPYGFRYYSVYKKRHTILMLAVVDINNMYLYVDVGEPGSASDSTTWESCDLKAAIDRNELVPVSLAVELDGVQVLPWFAVDAGFALSNRLLKCYPGNPRERSVEGRFNREVTNVRRHTECTFGHTKQRFAIMRTSRIHNPDFMADIVRVCCALHNLCKTRNEPDYLDPDIDSESDSDSIVEQNYVDEHEPGCNVRDAVAHNVRPYVA